jgi:hypothetical protein
MSNLIAEENILLKAIFNVAISQKSDYTKGSIFLPGLC